MKKDFTEFKNFIKGKKVAVVGIGVSNIPLMNFLDKLGAKITGFDIYPDDYAERGYSYVDKKTVISDVCEDCYNDIKNCIHDKIFETAKKQIKRFN